MIVSVCALMLLFSAVSGCGWKVVPPGADQTGKEDDTSADPTAGRDGTDGLDCWDLNGDGVPDPQEDTNTDGTWDARDCRGLPGQDGTDGADGADGPPGADGVDGIDGVSCWDLNENGVADAEEDRNADGLVDVHDCQGPAGPPGDDGQDGTTGPQGPQGPAGPEFVSVFIDDFYAADPTVPYEWPSLLSAVDDPVLGSAAPGVVPLPAVAFQTELPHTYDPAHALTVRAFYYRTGPVPEGCFVFTLEAIRLRDGLDMEPCGPRRWVKLAVTEDTPSGPLDLDPELTGLFVVDLPVYDLPGLDYLDDLVPGDLIAFEVAAHQLDGGAYHLLGVEVFESPQPTRLTGGEVFYVQDSVTCVTQDCNRNEQRDELDILLGTSNDCNDNQVPDECDLCETSNAAADAARPPFDFLAPGFTQKLYATTPDFLGGIAFTADGDLLVDSCLFTDSPLHRFDAQTVELVSGSLVHPVIDVLDSHAGCGLTNHADGTLFSNTAFGVTNIDPETGDLLDAGGPPGNGLGITAHPETGEVFYVAADGRILTIDPALTGARVFSSALQGATVQGLSFDESGDFLFAANRTQQALTIINRAGELVATVPVFHESASHEPAAVAVHASHPGFVLTVNVDGTMTRFDFPAGDYTQTPTQAFFADGGLHADLAQVGPDGCLYATQAGTRFADGTTTLTDSSIVRICGGFVPVVGVEPPIRLTPWADAIPVRTRHRLTARLSADASAVEGITINFEVIAGPNASVAGNATTDAQGLASFAYVGDGGEGTDQIHAWYEDQDGLHESNIAVANWVPLDCSLDCNTNGIPDECELADNDCNANLIPDECDGGCDP
jgi:hypothetical protein